MTVTDHTEDRPAAAPDVVAAGEDSAFWATFWEANAPFVFARRYEDGLSLRRIAHELTETTGTSVSSETIRKILAGDTRAELTAPLRDAYAELAAARSPVLPDDVLRDVFVAYHRKRQSLSAIARDLMEAGVAKDIDYSHVRRVLVGDGPYGPATAKLRKRFPPYEPRDGRGYRSPFDIEDVNKAFRLYFEDHLSLGELRQRTGIPRERFKAIVAGEELAEATAELRARYGTEVRPPHRPPKREPVAVG